MAAVGRGNIITTGNDVVVLCCSPQRKLFQMNHTQKVLKPCKLTDCKNGFAHWLHHLEQTFSCKEVQHKTFCPSAENDFMKPLHTPSEFHCGYL